MRRFIEKGRALRGVPRTVADIGCGALTALAMPPYHLTAFGAAGFSLFLLLRIMTDISPKRAFFDGAAYGFGFFLAGLYWIAFALTVDIARFYWLIPFAVCGIPLLLCLFTGMAAYLAEKCPPGRAVAGGKAVMFILFWMLIAEAARGYLLSGFPWNLLGYTWTESHTILQSAAAGGIWLLSLIACLAFAAPAFLYAAMAKEGSRVFSACFVFIGIAAPVAAHIYGEQRLAAYTPSFISNDKMRIVQPNIPQSLKWDPAARAKNMETLLTLSKTQDPDMRYILWPEAAVPYMMRLESGAPYAAEQAAPDNGAVITGIVRADIDEDTGKTKHLYNSLIVVSRDGVEAHYDKSHLVPFGEYVPFKEFLPFVQKITHGLTDFSPGDGPATIEAAGLPPFSPLICYEIIFPGATVANAPATRPAMILNITNDAWYGDTSGPYQHFAMAKVRAAEEGIPVIRAANSGISGVIDPTGKTVSSLALGTQGILDFRIPAPLEEPPFFSELMR